jgi:serine/threonine-protein kinase
METIEALGKYEVKRQLGRGAMGTVYEGWDPIIARRVAIKTVRLPDASDPETEEALARFRREAQAAGRLSHPNIVGVFDYGETADLAYIVMEFVDGPPLKTLLDKHERFALADTLRIMADLLAGLQFSHERGVVHRDIKPANVMLTSAGQAKLDDAGRHCAGHTGLYVARAVHGPGGGCALRHLLVGCAAISAPDRRSAVRGQHVGDHA